VKFCPASPNFMVNHLDILKIRPRRKMMRAE